MRSSRTTKLRAESVYPYLVLAAAAVGLALRLHGLGVPSLSYDEIGEAQVALSPSLGNLLAGVKGHLGATPLDYLLLRFFLIFGRSDALVRLPAVIYGVLSIPLLYAVGARFFGKAAGIVAASLLALSPFAVEYSQEARFYSLSGLVTLVTVWAFARALERKTRDDWALFAICSVIGLYGHYYHALVLVTAGLYLLLSHPLILGRPGLLQPHGTRELSAFIGSALLASLVFLPWLLYTGGSLQGLWPEAAPVLGWPLWRDTILPAWTGQRAGRVGYWLFVVVALLGILPLQQGRKGAILCVLAIGVNVPIILALDHLRDYFFNPRQTFFLLPFFLLLVVHGLMIVAEPVKWGIDRITAQTARWNAGRVIAPGVTAVSAILVTTLVVLLCLLSWQGVQAYYGRPAEADCRGVGQFLQNSAHPEIKITFVPNWSSRCITYYHKTAPLLAFRGDAAAVLAGLQMAYEKGNPLWIGYIYKPGRDAALEKWLANLPFLRFRFLYVDLIYLRRGSEVEALAQETADIARPPSILTMDDHSPAKGDLVYYADAKERANYYLNKGVELRKAKKDDEAIVWLRKALEIDPNNMETHNQLGGSLVSLNRLDEAATEFTIAKRLSPNSYWAHFYLGLIYRQQKRWDDSLAEYREALRIDPKQVEILARIAEVNEAAGKKDQAISSWREYLKAAPNGPSATKAQERLRALGATP